ncbi:hypothetical protein MXD63_03065 [Frankia sp. Cpl3]|nr:hypothetical protein [Frankia sp. Cpl3]
MAAGLRLRRPGGPTSTATATPSPGATTTSTATSPPPTPTQLQTPTPAPTTPAISPTPSTDTRTPVTLEATSGLNGSGIVVGVVPVSDRASQLPGATGTLTVHEGGKLLGTVTTERKGWDPYATGELDVDLPPGYHSLALDYSGDANYQPNRATVSANTSNVEVIASVPGSLVDGQPSTVEVQVVPLPGITGIPTGKVRNEDDFGLPPFEVTLDARGRATITIEGRPANPYITEPRQGHAYIEYLGDSTFVPNRTLVLFTVLPSTAA